MATVLRMPEPVTAGVIEQTVSMCPRCGERVPATLVERGGAVYLDRDCPRDGIVSSLREEDAAWYRGRVAYDKPGTDSQRQTATGRGCPYDCGLCPQHQQHTCIGLIEITGRCQLACPDCFAPGRQSPDLDLATLARMMDFFQAAEGGKAEILQLSGGEPTLHPDLPAIIALAREKRFKFILLNTNGLRLAEDEALVRELAQFRGGFEVYLQFDGLTDGASLPLRGQAVAAAKQRAVRNLTRHGVPVTLVTTVARGSSAGELGAIVEYGMRTTGVRGISFQTLALYDRAAELRAAKRLTLTGVLRELERQTAGLLRQDDFIPLPCDVESVAIAFCYRDGDKFVPISRRVALRDYVPAIRNTLAFDAAELARAVPEHGCDCLAGLRRALLPLVPAGFTQRAMELQREHIDRNTFRLTVTSFVDWHNCDAKALQRECVHVITPDLKRMPFSAYNMLHRAGQC